MQPVTTSTFGAIAFLHAALCGAHEESSAQQKQPTPTTQEQVRIASGFLRALSHEQQVMALFDFASGERFNWNFVPMQRKGVPLQALDEKGRALLDPLLLTALSKEGLDKAKAIIAHEVLLGELERERNVFNWRRRDPGLYYTSVFGTPSADSAWAWRFEGHHLSLNVTSLSGQQQIAAPLFMGANPARVPSGAKAGLRILAAEEDIARKLVLMLPPERRARAIISPTAFSDILTRNDPKVRLEIEGLAASSMSTEERALLRTLIEVYSGRLTVTAASEQWERIERAGFENLHFVWAGGVKVGEPHYYRVQGPTLLIEYDNTQNDANHVHSVWRDLERDFGGDLLRAHYERHEHQRHAKEHPH